MTKPLPFALAITITVNVTRVPYRNAGAQLKAMAKLVGEDPLAPMLLSRWDQEQAVLLDHRALTHPIQSLSGFVLNL